jgi:hypothetical protein
MDYNIETCSILVKFISYHYEVGSKLSYDR